MLLALSISRDLEVCLPWHWLSFLVCSEASHLSDKVSKSSRKPVLFYHYLMTRLF